MKLKFYFSFILYFVIYQKSMAQQVIAQSVVTQSNVVDATILDLPELQETLNRFKQFLILPDSSFVHNPNKKLSDYILDEYFMKQLYPADFLEHHILTFEQINDSTLLSKVINRINPRVMEDFNQDLSVNTIFNFELIKRKNIWKTKIRLRDELYHKVKTDFGEIWTKNKEFITPEILKEQQHFIQETIKKFKLPEPPKGLIYILDNYQNAYSALGFDFNFNNTGRYIQEFNLLISNTMNPIYKHELTHYLFASFSLNKLLSEGIAVYIGGSADLDFQSLKAKNKHYFELLSDSSKKEHIAGFLGKPLAQFESGYSTFYYTCAGILTECLIQELGIEGYIQLLRTKKELSEREIILKHLKLPEKQTPEQFILDRILMN